MPEQVTSPRLWYLVCGLIACALNQEQTPQENSITHSMSVEHIDTASLFRIGATSRRILNKERGIERRRKMWLHWVYPMLDCFKNNNNNMSLTFVTSDPKAGKMPPVMIAIGCTPSNVLIVNQYSSYIKTTRIVVRGLPPLRSTPMIAAV